ncbi:hypothetical protein KRG64_004809 [Escherichia coli]|nr:hypothetical protein [Escherichia coli]HBQ5059083.1 hypothetical protein [Klebsiella pneumoniae]HBR2118691.1 hypothetical protein [Klebsiella quasipneumoniae subsp. similipneumoniae]HDE1064529.1 hypothetical protein [Klebsiella quasipneumoniae]EFH8055401.1 hypothetical protein [Escherichia coli]
MFFDGHACMTI